MSLPFTHRLSTIALLSALSLTAQAQYLFQDATSGTSNGLGPYKQNFDGLAGTKALFASNSTLLGVYARFTLDGYGGDLESSYRGSGAQAKLAPDDGSEGPAASTVDADGTPHGAAWYHFGQAGGTDRALGGIASTTVGSGKGYVGIRLKNSSSKVISNLEISYAMEQWYNSSKTQAANVTVEYQRSTSAITSPIAGTWTSVDALSVAAPSTSTAIAPRNGNAATNRRVLQYTLANLNLAKNEEIMIRFGYVFNSGTNGNGLSIDDIVITPETNVFYSSSTSPNLNALANWGTNTDGTGTKPLNFTADNTTYYVQGTAAGTQRFNGAWKVSGANSKIIVGTAAAPANLYVGAGDQLTGTVDVGPKSTLQISQTNNNLTLGALDGNSTVEYLNAATSAQNVKGASYGNLKLTDVGPKTLDGAVQVNTGLAFNTATTAALTLGSYDLLLLKSAPLTGLNGASTVFVTNGAGSLRRTVPSDGTKVVFPVATAAGAYTPATLSQTQANSEDTYSVRLLPAAYASYDANYVGQGPAVVSQNVQKTWLVSEEVLGNSSVTLALQWNPADASSDFNNATAHVNHYTAGTWDQSAAVGATAGTATGSYTVSRAGITSFSPFAVSSRTNGALPVELTAFGAHSTGRAVACTWATASESNSRDFAVERSIDGRTFGALGTVAAAGNSSSTHTYAFTDADPLPGTSYYRLRQTDRDGTVVYSVVVSVLRAAATAVPVVVPNPGTGPFTVLGAADAIVGPGVVRNALGAVVLSLPSLGSTGTFDLSGQPAGLYLLQIQTADGLRTLRVIKR